MSEKEIKELEVEFEEVKNKLELAQKLHTPEGFFMYWFESLAAPENSDLSKTEVFDKVNSLYKSIFNTKYNKYSSYKSFLKVARVLRDKDDFKYI